MHTHVFPKSFVFFRERKPKMATGIPLEFRAIQETHMVCSPLQRTHIEYVHSCLELSLNPVFSLSGYDLGQVT